MAQCEMCGSEASLVNARVEGTTMKVCSNCSRFGITEKTPSSQAQSSGYRKVVTTGYKKIDDDGLLLFANAGALVKAAREKMGLRQIDLSKRLNIKESIIHQFEAGHMQPTADVVKKFEEGLSVKLLGKAADARPTFEKPTTMQGFTIGDMIKNKLKK